MLLVEPATLKPLVLDCSCSPRSSSSFAACRRQAPSIAAARAHRRILAIGIARRDQRHDGFFGPGTGTFADLAFVLLLREP